ncbi:MAG: hypothetical protein V4580_04790 [Bacteroidota bacterium]
MSQHDISKYERRWAFFHPFAAFKIKGRLKQAMVIYQEVKSSKQLDDFESGGTLDAFRHSFSMAYLGQKINIKKLRKLGIAHEKGNKLSFEKNKLENGDRPDSLACEMDLRNNELGFLIGSANKKLAINELRLKMLAEIKSGNAWILKRNDKKEYISCNNEPVLINNYANKWFLPKCLVKSNQ